MKCALSISISDSSGAGGVQADLKTFSVLGIYGMTALTAVTAQNTQGVRQTHALPTELVVQQIAAAAGDIEVEACKSGALINAAIVEAVYEAIGRNKLSPYVCDPVLTNANGDEMLDEEGVQKLKARLLPLATLLTPTRAGAARLTGLDRKDKALASIPGAKEIARRLTDAGARAVLIKGFESGDQTVDLFFDGSEFLEFTAKTQPREKSNGAADVFSAAITAGLALRLKLVEAIDQAKNVVTMAIQYSDGQGRGVAPVNVLSFSPKKK